MSGGGIGYKMLGRRVPCSVSFPVALIERLDLLATRNRTSRSWVIEQILAGWIKEHEAKLGFDCVEAIGPVRSPPARRVGAT